MESAKVKKEKVLSLTDTVRLFSSSISARNAKYLYLNVLDDPYSFVLSNADYALLAAFVPHILSLHIVKLEPSEYTWFDTFKKQIGVTTNEPYLLNLASMNKHLTKTKLEELAFINNDHKIRIANVEVPDTSDEDYVPPVECEDDNPVSCEPLIDDAGVEMKEEPAIVTFNDKTIYGFKIDEFQMLTNLKHLIEKTLSITPEYLAQVPHKTVELARTDYFHSNVYKLGLDSTSCAELEEFLHKSKISLLLIDGSDTVSLKEFIKKAPKDMRITLTVYQEMNSNTFKTISTCTSSKFTVVSCRPHAGTIFLRKEYS